jgi:hypothetical protein
MAKELRDVILKVGDPVTLKAGFATKTVLIYGGMPAKDLYSLVITSTSGYNSMAYNLYYPSSRRNVAAGKRLLEILAVTPDQLRLNVLDPPRRRE